MSDRQGRILAKRINGGISVASIICQTDFLAKTDLMLETLDKLCDMIPSTYRPNGTTTLSDVLLKNLEEKSKEKIILWECFYIPEEDGTVLEYYMHHDNKKFAIVELSSERTKETSELCRNIAMHIVASNPKCISIDNVDWTDVDLEIPEKLLKTKSPKIIEKIKEGKKNKHIKQHVLLEQSYIKDPKKTICQVIREFDQDVKITEYQRIEI